MLAQAADMRHANMSSSKQPTLADLSSEADDLNKDPISLW